MKNELVNNLRVTVRSSTEAFTGGHDFIKDSVIDMTKRELVNNLGVRVGSGTGALKAAMCAVDDNSMTGFSNGSEEQILQTFAISLAEKHHCGARVSHVSRRFVFGADHRIFCYFTRGDRLFWCRHWHFGFIRGHLLTLCWKRQHGDH